MAIAHRILNESVFTKDASSPSNQNKCKSKCSGYICTTNAVYMKISYKWLSDFLPFQLSHEKLSGVLTSLGLEVESVEKYESVKGSLAGVVIGKIVHVEQHPNADKLKITKVDIGGAELLSIVCGAPNVAAGQTVAVATIGTILHSFSGEEITLKPAKIRGEKSEGMICAEDELGLSENHDGIMLLPDDCVAGEPAANYLDIYEDVVFEIGLTPNRTDAMSHYGVARDLLAHYNYHHNTRLNLRNPFVEVAEPITDGTVKISVDSHYCSRYCGVIIEGLQIKESPKWLQHRLSAIGVRPVNNVVDATNYILHALGQPLHAFDWNTISGGTLRVEAASGGERFVTLDEKERILQAGDIMIRDATKSLCMAGIFGGANSAVNSNTAAIFLESAVFDAAQIRKSSIHHNLRTEAATRFEKQVDIDITLSALKTAAKLIIDVAGGTLASGFADVFPNPPAKTTIELKTAYVHRLSGKSYTAEEIKTILQLLGFDIINETEKSINVGVPFYKSDVKIAADLVEEIIRIDGLENIPLPANMSVSPQISKHALKERLKAKIGLLLCGEGLSEIVTNSITNSKYYSEKQLETAVKMINNLSSELDVLRPSMLETGLEVIAFNVNRKNPNLQLFEFGKLYSRGHEAFIESEHLSIYLTGKGVEKGWNTAEKTIDFFYAKGLAEAVLKTCGFKKISLNDNENYTLIADNKAVGYIHIVDAEKRKMFDIKQAVFQVVINIQALEEQASEANIRYKEISRFPAVERDLSMLVSKHISYGEIRAVAEQLKIARLKKTKVFDVFESEKLGHDKKSIALSFSFLDEEKTLTDKEVDGMMQKLMQNFEKQLNAEIRKS